MSYTTLQTIAIACYMVAAGFLAVSVLIFFLWDMRDIIGRLTGSSQRKALAQMRSGDAIGKTGGNVVDMSALEKSGTLKSHSSGPSGRRSGRVAKPIQSKPDSRPLPQPQPELKPLDSKPDYFGAPYPNKTPPTPIPAAQGASPEPQTSVIQLPSQTTVIQAAAPQNTPPPAGGETMDLEQWQRSRTAAQQQRTTNIASGMVAEDDLVEPVEMKILDDIVLVHTETFIKI